MNEFSDKFLQSLEQQADRWLEEELSRRMVRAKETIQEQVNISLPEIGPAHAAGHLKNALVFAREQIRMELELEARAWVEGEVERRRAAAGENAE